VTGSKGQKECICFSNYLGLTCNFTMSSCTNGSYCQNGGTCLPTTLNMAGYTCNCVSGFTGTKCQSSAHKLIKIKIIFKSLIFHFFF